MADPIFPDISGTIEFAFFPLDQEEVWDPIRTPFESGHIQVRPRHTMRRRRIQWVCRVLDPIDLQRVMGFLVDRKGGGNWFFIQNRNPQYIWPPYDARPLADVAGGTKGGRTLFVQIAYANLAGTLITTANVEDSHTLGASRQLTVEMPDFPTNVERANLYIGTATGVLYYSGASFVPLETWQEDEATTTVNVDSPLGTDILFVAATTNFKQGNSIVVDPSGVGGGTEYHIIENILSGPARIQIEGTLANTHTAAQADPVNTLVGDSNFASPPTANNFAPELIKVVLVNEPRPILISSTVYELTLIMEEILP